MFQCNICGSTKAKEQFIDMVFQIDNKPVLVEHIPAMVCSRCDEETFSRETTERIRRMVHDEGKPVKSISMDVYAFA